MTTAEVDDHEPPDARDSCLADRKPFPHPPGI